MNEVPRRGLLKGSGPFGVLCLAVAALLTYLVWFALSKAAARFSQRQRRAEQDSNRDSA